MRSWQPLLAFLAAAGYFAIGIRLPLEWADAGQLVYPGWRVSQGAVPYRDLVHLYGPSFHYLNAGLFRLFGEDLVVLRGAMVVSKAAIATFVYLAARRVAPAPIALVAYLMLVSVFGLPFPVFSSSYAGHHGMAIVYAGLLILAALPARPVQACVLAGLCFGLASTFKQTSGAFAFVATALFLLTERVEASSPPSGLLLSAARAARAAVLAGSVAFFGYYLSKENTTSNVGVLMTPLLIIVVRLALDERRGRVPPACQIQSLSALLALSLGAALPIATWALWFAFQGLLPELVFNTVTGVPDAHAWFVPYRLGGTTWLVWVATVGAGAAGLSLWGRAPRRRSDDVLRGVVSLAFVVGAAELLRRGAAVGIGGDWWFWLSSDLYHVVPGAVAWLGAIVCFGWDRQRGSQKDPVLRRTTLLFTCFAATAIFLLYPNGDILHALMALPAFIPLLAALSGRLLGGSDGSWRRLTAVFTGALALLFAAPPVIDLYRESQRRASDRHGFERATGISGSTGVSRGAAQLVAALREPPFADRELFVLSGKQLIYFLTGQPSAVEPYEFGLYMVSGDLISDEGVALLIDELDLVQRLRDTRPVIVDDSHNVQGENVRRRLPRLADYVDRNYAPVRRVGGYTIFLPRSQPHAREGG